MSGGRVWDTTMAILPNQYSAMAYTSFYNLSSFGTSFKVAIKSGRHQLLNFAVENRQEWEEPSGLGSMRRRCKQCKDIWLPLCLWNHRLLLFLTSVKNSRERTCASWTPSTVLSFRGGYLSVCHRTPQSAAKTNRGSILWKDLRKCHKAFKFSTEPFSRVWVNVSAVWQPMNNYLPERKNMKLTFSLSKHF